MHIIFPTNHLGWDGFVWPIPAKNCSTAGFSKKNATKKMARMHARKKGKHSSTKPARSLTANWVSLETEEIIELIIKLAKEGNSQSKIGIILRDQYGIGSVKKITGKSMGQIFAENELAGELPEDLSNLINKAINLRTHLSLNKKDVHNKSGLQLIESKIRRLVKYYRKNGKIPSDWRYDPNNT